MLSFITGSFIKFCCSYETYQPKWWLCWSALIKRYIKNKMILSFVQCVLLKSKVAAKLYEHPILCLLKSL